MADQCTITSVSIEQPERGEVGLHTAIAVVSCAASLPADHVEEGSTTDWGAVSGSWSRTSHSDTMDIYVFSGSQSRTRVYLKFKDLRYTFTPHPGGEAVSDTAESSVNLRFAGLTEKTSNDIYATVKVTCTKERIQQRQTRSVSATGYTTYDENGKITSDYTSDYSYGTPGSWTDGALLSSTPGSCENSMDSDPITVWTRPNIFDGYSSFSTNDIIYYKLTSSLVSEWKTHATNMHHWFTQSDANPPNIDGCSASTNEVIKASWFINCANICNLYKDETGVTARTDISGGPQGTIIRANLFPPLGQGISKDGEAY